MNRRILPCVAMWLLTHLGAGYQIESLGGNLASCRRRISGAALLAAAAVV